MLKRLKTLWPIIFLVFISVILCVKNYAPGTILSGWDTLHPEFNFQLNFERVLFGVFRNEQGLGAVAAHSHMADLPRILFLFIAHFFLPLNVLRYLYVFCMLILGPVGMYLFLYKTILKNKTAAFLGGLFYLLNLGIMQQFVVPFEMFVTQCGFLPWLFLFATEYLTSGRKSRLLLFTITTLLATPMAYAATLWYMYFLALSLYLFTSSCFSQNRRILFKKTVIILAVTVLVNSFWLLPNIYFVLTQASLVSQATINKVFSEEAFLYNKEFGNFHDISQLKSFLFDWGIYNGQGNFEDLLSSWSIHLKMPLVEIIGFLTAAVAFFGVLFSIVKKNTKILTFLPLFFLCIFFLINDNFPTGFLYSFFQTHIPFFKEALRFPDDKILVLSGFVFSIYFAYGQSIIIKRLRHFSTVYTLLFSALLFFFMLPAFQGNLINPSMRIKIPDEYFQMFDWFNKQADDGRVANLPINSFWGWEYYKWGYQGAGFLWFGMKQPLLARDFDRWNQSNEQYYREMSYAVYTKNPALFANVLKKYNIHYVLLDTSLIAPQENPQTLFYDEIKTLLKNLEEEGSIKKVAQFGDHLFVFGNALPPSQSYTYSTTDGGHTFQKAGAFPEDFVFEEQQPYVTASQNNTQEIMYPFRNIIDNQNKFLKNALTIGREGLVLPPQTQNKLPESFSLPDYVNSETRLPANLSVKRNGQKLTISFYPLFPLDDGIHKPIPITTDVSLPADEKNVLISINQKDNFILNNIPENTPFFVGTIILNTQSDNTIAFYPNVVNQTAIPDFSTSIFTLDSCGDKEQLFGILPSATKDGFTIFGKNTPVCMIIPLSNLIDRNSLLLNSSEEFLMNIKFNYHGESKPNLCIVELTTGGCLNYISKNILLEQTTSNRTSEFFGLKKDDINNLGVKIFLDISTGKADQKSTYDSFQFAFTKPFSLTHFSKEMVAQSLAHVQSTQGTNITIPFYGSEAQNLDITTLPKTTGDCETNQRINSPNRKIQIVKKGINNYIEYSSEEGSVCDHFSYQMLSQDQAYIILITSRNKTGLPLRLCVTNYVSKRCDIYTHLSNSQSFTQEAFLLPPMGSGTGYDININNLGIKGTPSINDLSSIQIVPFPYRFLSQIKSVTQYQKSSELLVFSKSFDKGWVAYAVSGDNFLNQTFPFLFGKKLGSHVLVNNWENGWVLNSQLSTLNSQLVIVYLPQYLEYLGFIILLGIPILILRSKTLISHH